MSVEQPLKALLYSKPTAQQRDTSKVYIGAELKYSRISD